MTKPVADVLLAAARARHASEPTFGMLYLAAEAAELGERDAAREIVKRATAKDEAAWFALLATVYAKLGEDIGPLAAKALKSPSSWVHSELATAYEWLGDHVRADEQIALVKKAQRFATIAAVARIALAAGDRERAATLAQQPWARKSDPGSYAALHIELALAHATAGDAKTARRLLDEAERLDPDASIPDRAKAWAALGDKARARDIAARVDKGRYKEIASLELARAYEAAGDTAKVDAILAAYAGAADDAEGALTYLQFGRELGVRKRLKAAEAKLATTSNPDSLRSSLASAFVLDKQFVTAIDHIAAIEDPELRVQRLLEVARGLRDAKVASSPELEAAIARLP